MPRKPREKKHRGVFERESGSGIWWVRFVDLDGKRKSRCIGTFNDAVDFYEGQKVRIRKGVIAPVVSHRGIRYGVLLDDALTYSKTSHRDQRVFAQRVEVTREQFGNRIAETITPADISEWFTAMTDERTWTPATVNRYRAAMSKAFKIGIQNRKVSSNPARLVPQRKEPPGKIRFLTNDEEKRLRAALKDRPFCIPQLDVALHTGMRKSEQFSVTWDQVDVAQKYIHLNVTKNGSDRYVSLNSEVLRALKELKETHASLNLPADSTLFLSHQKKPMSDPREWFSEACDEAKVQGVTWHTLRHTFASRLVMAGVDLKTVQELMGHKTIAMTARYAHLSPEHKLSALERLVTTRKRGRVVATRKADQLRVRNKRSGANAAEVNLTPRE
jgi:site-specific recombinase XerD